MSLLFIVVFAVSILVSIMLHEYGHMWCARKAGGKVTDFFVGFGPKLWSFRRGETEYGVKALPLGGFVKIVGMTDLEPIDPEDESRAFYRKPLRWRLTTLAAGSFMHFVIALVLLVGVSMSWGRVTQDTSGVIGTVTSCVKTTTGDCAPGDPQSPAAGAGLQAGDKIVAVNGVPVHSWQDVTDQLHKGQPAVSDNKPANPVSVTYLRNGQTTTVPITPQRGNLSVDKNKYVAGLLIGIQAPKAVTHHLSPVAAVGQGFADFGTYAKESVDGLAKIPGSVPKLFKQTTTNAPRTADTPSSMLGVGRFAGDLGTHGDWAALLSIIALVNMFIGIFNLLPLLPLDGGHIAIALYEAARRKIAVLRKRPDPGRVDLNKLMPAAFAFLVIFGGLFVLLIAADVVNPLKLPS